MLSIKHRGHRFAAVVVGTCLALVVGSVTAPAAAAASGGAPAHRPLSPTIATTEPNPC